MKKLLGVAIALVLCLAVAPGAFAIDDGSLEKMTTEGLYDRNDAFDHALEPGLLYNLDRWRLYTNLSGYDSNAMTGDRECCFNDGDWDTCNWEDSGSYLIGTSGPLGPGNVAFFYETNRYDFDGKAVYREVETEEYTDSNGEYPTYDGLADWEYTGFFRGEVSSDFFRAAACPTCTNAPDAKGEIEENNFYVAYGMDFDMFSLGLSYAPEIRNEEVSVRVQRSGDDFPLDSFYESMPGYLFYDRIWRNMDYRVGFQRSYVDDYKGYGETEHDTFTSYHEQATNSGTLDRDINIHPVHLQSHIRPGGNWDVLAGVGYKSIKYEDDFSAALSQSGASSDSTNGLTYRWSGQVNVDGSVCEDRDGDEWSIYVSPTYMVNDLVSVRLDLSYATEDGDIKGGQVAQAYYTETAFNDQPGPDPVETWTYRETQHQETVDGDYDIDTWNIEPRVYLTFDRVKFALGAGYQYKDEDVKYQERTDVSARYTYNIAGGGAALDRVFEGGFTDELRDVHFEVKTDTWRFPVATEFMVTDKLTFRAGAAYYRQTIDADSKVSAVYNANEHWKVTDGEGNLANSDPTGPEDQYKYAGDDPRPYDADTDTERIDEDFELTTDWTTYNLGLGYQFTENLQMDLMWAGKGESGGVDMTEVFASITLAF